MAFLYQACTSLNQSKKSSVDCGEMECHYMGSVSLYMHFQIVPCNEILIESG